MAPSTSVDRRQDDERDASDILPSEIWTEILVRLPVRSLLTLKSVSKTFLSLINNPNFTSLHFSRFHNSYSHSTSNGGSSLLLLERQNSQSDDLPCPSLFNSYWDYFLVHRSFTPTESVEFRAPIYRGGFFDVFVLGSVNGLLLLDTPSKDMVLYNPLIRKSLMIPPSPSSHLGRTILGFGYDPMNDDYKVLSIVYVKDKPSLNPESESVQASPRALVEVYSFRGGLWRTLGFDALSRGWFLGSQVYVDGCLHWIAGWDENDRPPDSYVLTHVVSFNLGTELFSYRGLPDFGVPDFEDDPLFYMSLLAVSFHGSLAVACLERKISFWVMREGDWTKECCVEVGPGMYKYREDDKDRFWSEIFCEGSNELMAAGFDGMISYNIETQEFKSYGLNVAYVDNYVESLIWGEWADPFDLFYLFEWVEEDTTVEA